MTSEQFELLSSVMDEVVSGIEKYPLHLQPTILGIFWEEWNRSSQSFTGEEDSGSRELPVNGSKLGSDLGERSSWDFRRGILQLARDYDLALKQPRNYEYACIVAYVLKFENPDNLSAGNITNDHVFDAWRTAGRKLPNRPREPLSEAAKKGLLDKANGHPGYVLSPAGENLVNDILNHSKSD